MRLFKVYISLPPHHYSYVLLVQAERNDAGVLHQVEKWQDKNGLTGSVVTIDHVYDVTDELPVEFYDWTSDDAGY